MGRGSYGALSQAGFNIGQTSAAISACPRGDRWIESNVELLLVSTEIKARFGINFTPCALANRR
jgi:hypothetical protein